MARATSRRVMAGKNKRASGYKTSACGCPTRERTPCPDWSTLIPRTSVRRPTLRPQLQTKFDKESDSNCEIVDNNADLVHTPYRHVPEHRTTVLHRRVAHLR